MNWKKRIFKPKWQHKNPDIRIPAIAGMQDPDLLDQLATICLEDEEPGARIAACGRISDLTALSAATGSEQDTHVMSVLQQRILTLTASESSKRPPLNDRQKIVSASSDRNLLERVAIHAPEAELRLLALGKIERQGFLGDRAISDTDPLVRRAAAKAITQLSTIKRVIDQTRKTDKSLHQNLSARLHGMLLNENNPVAIESEATAICKRLEDYALTHQQGQSEVPDDISAAWAIVSDQVSESLSQRYQHLAERLAMVPLPLEPKSVVPAPESDASTEAAPTSSEPEEEIQNIPEPTKTNPLPGLAVQLGKMDARRLSTTRLEAFQSKWQASITSQEPLSDDDRLLNEQVRERLDQLLKTLNEKEKAAEAAWLEATTLLETLNQQLEDGALHKALATRHRLMELAKASRKDSRWKAVSNELQTSDTRLRELRDWQHWSNDKVREQLIAEAELLPKVDLHPDAILDRLKALQARWKELEKTEQIPGDDHYHAAPSMWRRFSSAGNEAFTATKPFLEKRDEIRNKQVQELQDLCQELTEVAAAESPDRARIGKLLNSAKKELRGLDHLPYKLRQKVANRLRKAIDKGNAVIQSHFEVVEKAKLKLIREAAQLVHLEDRDEAIAKAKSLQADWRKAGSLWRSRENELWKEFREPLDPLFEQLKTEQSEQRESDKLKLESQRVLCQELKALLDTSDDALTESQGKLQGLKDAWRDVVQPDRELHRKFQQMVEQFEQRAEQAALRQAGAVRRLWWEKSELLHQLESASHDGKLTDAKRKKLQKAWPENQPESDIDRQLDARFAAALEPESDVSPSLDNRAEAISLCIQLEFLAGIASPDSEKEQRMKYQVDRLSKSLSGESIQQSVTDEVQVAESQWLTLALLSKNDFETCSQRIKSAIEQIDRDNND